MSSHTVLYAMISVMVLFWSGNYIVGKVALREFPPLLLSGMRVLLSAVFILPFYWWERRRASAKRSWNREDLPILVFLGVCGVALNQLFFVLGLSRTSAAHASIIMGLTPLFVLLIASFKGLERLTLRKVAGMAIALGGVAILRMFQDEGHVGNAPTLLGDFFTALAALAFALFAVFGKPVTKRYSSVTVNTFGYVCGALTLAPVTVWQVNGFDFARISLAGWASLIYMSLFPSVICYLIFYYALSHISASRVSAFSYLQPAIATMLAVVLLGERVTLPVIAGGAVIFSGVYLTERG